MVKDSSSPQIGQIVYATQGRDKDQYAVIIRILDDRYVLLADGHKRKYDRPKKKNIRHIRKTPFIAEDIRESLLETGRVSNGKLRFAVDQYERKVVTE